MWRASIAVTSRSVRRRASATLSPGGRADRIFGVEAVRLDRSRFLSSPSPAPKDDPSAPEGGGVPRTLSSLSPRELGVVRAEMRRSARAEKAAASDRSKLENGTRASWKSAEERKRKHLRRMAAQAVPHLLGTDSVLFESVLRELNLSASSSYDSNRADGSWMEYEDIHDSRKGAFSHYRAMYLDSIPSFTKILAENPASVDRFATRKPKDGGSMSTSNSESSRPNNRGLYTAEQLLDELVEAGFGDTFFVRQFRHHNNTKAKLAKYAKRLEKKRKMLTDREDRLQELKQKLENMKQNLVVEQGSVEGEVSEPSRPKESDSCSEISGKPKPLTESILGMMRKMLGLSSEDREKPSPVIRDIEGNDEMASSVKAKLGQQAHRRRVTKLQNSVSNAEMSVLGTKNQIKRLEEEHEKRRPLLTDEEYILSIEAARRVLMKLSSAFAAHMLNRHAQMIEQYRTLDTQTDLTKPQEWFPHARLDKRKIIFHAGPTNSGKTYCALQRLKSAERGLYLAPLRLLAAEVYETLTSQGVYTNLFTGQERRDIPFSTHTAATVEMAPTDRDFDIVVIDEIQMISDPFRGCAWTRALLGIRCKEIHVCGGLEAYDLVKKIVEFCGDELELTKYPRFSALAVADKSISHKSDAKGSYSAVLPGDCVVAFSRNDIFAIKREIESTTEYKCCVVYGSLPASTRTDQARRFNDPNSGYDILVASDAIGMGLNLNIRRIIFNSIYKSTGDGVTKLDHSAVKQIAGRAGRRNSPFPNGEVTCRDPADMEYLRQCMGTEIQPIKKAGLIPTPSHFEKFSLALQKYGMSRDVHDLHSTIRQFSQMAKVKGDFFLCRKTQMQFVAKLLDGLPLTINEKYTYCMAPINKNDSQSVDLLKNFAQKQTLGEVSGLNIRKIAPKRVRSFDTLSRLCTIHNELELFLWLMLKFPGNAMEQHVAETMKERLTNHINEGLSNSENLKSSHCYIKRDKSLRAAWARKNTGELDAGTFHDFVHKLDESDDVLPHLEADDI